MIKTLQAVFLDTSYAIKKLKNGDKIIWKTYLNSFLLYLF